VRARLAQIEVEGAEAAARAIENGADRYLPREPEFERDEL
jgi:hypothetical protein